MGEGILTRRGNGLTPAINKYFLANEANVTFAQTAGISTFNTRGAETDVFSVTSDNNFVYSVGRLRPAAFQPTKATLRKYHKSNMGVILNNTTFDANGFMLNRIRNTPQDDFVYITRNNNTLAKHHKENFAIFGEITGLTLVANHGFTLDDDYIYVALNSSSTNNRLRKYYKSNLALAAESAVYALNESNMGKDIQIKDNKIYSLGARRLTVFNQTDLTVLSDFNISPATTGTSRAGLLHIDDNLVYISSNTAVTRYFTNNLTELDTTSFASYTPNTNGGFTSIDSFTGDENFVYLGGRPGAAQRAFLVKAAKENFSATGVTELIFPLIQSETSMDGPTELRIDGEFIYASLPSATNAVTNTSTFTHRVHKINKRQVLSDDSTGLLTFNSVSYVREDILEDLI